MNYTSEWKEILTEGETIMKNKRLNMNNIICTRINII